MRLVDWNLYHSFSTYFTMAVDLEAAAEALVDTGVATLAFRPDGKIWFKKGDQVLTTNIEIDKKPYFAQASLTLDPDLDDFQVEFAYEAARMEVSERHLLSNRESYVPSHIRLLLGECRAKYDWGETILYPQLKLFESGVLITSLRVISPSITYDINQFVNDHLNAYRVAALELEMPPGLLRTYARGVLFQSGQSLLERIQSVGLATGVEDWIESKTVAGGDGDFQFERVPLDGFPISGEPGHPEEFRNIKSIVTAIQGAVQTALTDTKGGFRFLLFGTRTPKTEFGRSWTGHPNVHILSFKGQPETKTKLVRKFATSLAQIMYRSGEGSSLLPGARDALGPDLRPFEDYAVFMNEALTLWVCSKQGLQLKAYGNPDPNFAHILDDKQVQAEFVDYLAGANNQLAERVNRAALSLNDIEDADQELSFLEQAAGNVSSFGEIRTFFRYAEEKRGLAVLRDQTKEVLRTRRTLGTVAEESAARRFGWLLTILLGIAGVPALGQIVVRPLWRWSGWWLPSSYDAGTLFSVSIAAGAVFVLVALVWFLTIVRSPS